MSTVSYGDEFGADEFTADEFRDATLSKDMSCPYKPAQHLGENCSPKLRCCELKRGEFPWRFRLILRFIKNNNAVAATVFGAIKRVVCLADERCHVGFLRFSIG
ncbi:hypothetical protein B1R32_12910 [Abditibacterium utsteinense]|uniref:Uncharacterized protein n=1 Tax=Abditibacterium utsteinense TaxID=1960156 RepID=A0A2S8SP40_9BACT|nr:hypothetical protein B1R32_12910 [Abditibacterium utsteinense]